MRSQKSPFKRIGKGSGAKKLLKIDWLSLIRFKRTFTEGFSHEVEKMFADMGIDMYHGIAQFENKNTVTVKKDKLKVKYIFLATGSKPRKLKIPGEEYVITSEEFMETEKLPERIIFIGGGYVSFEFAHIARRAGVDVSILHRSERPLGTFDSDMVDLLVRASEAAGIRILTNRPVVAIEKGSDGFLVRTEYKNGAG